MIEFRYVTKEREYYINNNVSTTAKEQRLQYRILFYPYKIASGDIVLKADMDAKWQDIPILEDI